MATISSDTSHGGIDQLSFTCLGLFKKLSETLNGKTSHESRTRVDIARLGDEYGRMKIWCDENELDSLDHRLRDDEALRAGIHDTMLHMKVFLELTLELCSGCLEGLGLTGQPVDSNNDSILFSPAPKSDNEAIESNNYQTALLMSVYMSHLFSKVDLLYRFNTLLHRPKIRDTHSRPIQCSSVQTMFVASEGASQHENLLKTQTNPSGQPQSRTLEQSAAPEPTRQIKRKSTKKPDAILNRPISQPTGTKSHEGDIAYGTSTSTSTSRSGNRQPDSSKWRWNCCSCNFTDLSYTYDYSCTNCSHQRDVYCMVWATG
ncbi:hypothetical protein F5Y19DRAFT_455283 [Xylariaceae sp. FL1651]|nr:hypothetical protein F5Y19DRAFT_455283 [Xylariaceae sp. FL1651]